MRNLINFIVRYSSWFVFAFYVLISCVLLFRDNSYQGSVYLTSANAVSSGVNRVTSGISEYFALRQINRQLQRSNAELENRLLNMREELKHYKALAADSTVPAYGLRRFDYVMASVINNSVRHPRNYFTIDRGYADGVERGMGVVDQNGIVGIVNVSGPHTARVISVLSRGQNFSVKIKGTQFVGSMVWPGTDPTVAYMEEVPRHARFVVGDTIVSSGYSTTFPEGIAVGTVMNKVRGADDNFFTLKIRLASDFKNLTTVRVIKDYEKAELDSLATFDVYADEERLR